MLLELTLWGWILVPILILGGGLFSICFAIAFFGMDTALLMMGVAAASLEG